MTRCPNAVLNNTLLNWETTRQQSLKHSTSALINNAAVPRADDSLQSLVVRTLDWT
jgi:hypothetical protein